MKTLEQRLNKLEKETRWYRRATLVLGLMIVAGVTMGQTGSDIVDVLKCRKLEVYDLSGKVTAKISSDEDGGSLWIYNASGKHSAYIGNNENGGSLWIYNALGETTALTGDRLAIYNASDKASARTR